MKTKKYIEVAIPIKNITNCYINGETRKELSSYYKEFLIDNPDITVIYNKILSHRSLDTFNEYFTISISYVKTKILEKEIKKLNKLNRNE